MSEEVDFYTPGAHEKPSGVFVKVTLLAPCPSEGHVSRYGVAVAGNAGTKAAHLLSWGDLLRAVAWAASRSPAFRADLRKILDQAESSHV